MKRRRRRDASGRRGEHIRLRVLGGCVLVASLAAALPVRSAAGQAEFFRSDSALPVTLRTDLRALRGDRDTADAPWREATLAFAGADGVVSVPLRVRTRGIFRLANCDFPPIRLRFSESDVRGTPLEGLRRPKLVTHCRDRDEYEQYVLEEYVIYRILRLFTPVSFSARLLRVTYEDAAGASRPVTRYAFVTEDPERLAARLGATIVTQQRIPLGQLTRSHAALISLFQYLIANTDWSVPSLHNILLLRTADSTLHAVPYDFDWSGVIAPPYARPAAILPTRSVRERIWRGPCQSAEVLEPVLARFEALRDTIGPVYRTTPGLVPEVIERSLRYYEEFYRAIEDRQGFVRRVVGRDCGR